MVNQQIIKELEGNILKVENKIINSLKYPDKRIAIIQITRALDVFFLGVLSGSIKNKTLGNIYANGWAKAFMLFYDDTCDNDGMLLFPSNKVFEEWVNSIIINCGNLGYCEKIIRLYKTGLIDIKEVSRNTFTVENNVKYIGIESHEVQEHQWFNDQIKDYQKIYIDQLQKDKKYVLKKMKQLVFSWRKDFIGYDADPEIDIYYETLGIMRSETMTGIDNFHQDSTFGGYSFKLYCKIVAILMGLALKHVDFCLALIEKNRNRPPNIWNILTKWSSIQDYSREIAIALDANQSEIINILSTLTLSRDNKAIHCFEPDSPFAPYIKIGRDMIMHSISGMLNTPYLFMLKELNRMYPKDWDKAVQKRERLFRNELYLLFSDNLIKIKHNIALRREDGSVITDIDASIIDLENGVIGLFQLKWNDHFILYGRENKKISFYKECNEWISNVKNWFIIKL